jgi:nucleoside-diphosphate-sugar epimerase
LTAHDVFVTGGTGYVGRRLIPALLERGHRVRALVRPGSEGRLPRGPETILGSALDRRTFAAHIAPSDTFVHLVGTPRPSPAKARQFGDVDLASAREALKAAVDPGVAHFVYVSVAQPAPIMRAYIAARAEAEALIRASGLRATILRPWYVLGPGHRWPHALQPMYWLLERIPSTRAGAQRLGLVKLDQMVRALVAAVENPPDRVRIITVPEIRAGAQRAGDL